LTGRNTKTGSKASKSNDVLWAVPRSGIGYDVHALVPGRTLILGGVKIPSAVGLLGHSDADVLLHAFCDALLGAAALGDIGKHFPPSNPKYKDISSLKLLRHVGNLLKKSGFTIVHLDATVILQRPKILRYSPAMIDRIAATLGVDTRSVSIKATTNEGLGFTGRGEGCAALAIATIVPLRTRK